MKRFVLHLLMAAVVAATGIQQAQAKREILNASIDVSRELFAALNPKFEAYWKAKTSEDVIVNQSHQGSSKQARAILEGLPADVVTFNQVTDVQVLHDQGNLIPADWQKRLPDDSSPYYSLTSFLVRKGNPKSIKDWDDLARPGIQVVFPNPKTSGNGRYTYLAAWAYARRKYGSDAQARAFVQKILKNVAVFDTGGRGATTTFVERGIGDVLVTFESETLGIRKQYGADKYDVIAPSLSIAATFPVAWVDKVDESKGTLDLAQAYLKWLYSEEAQDIEASQFYRIRSLQVVQKYASQFPKVELLDVKQAFGGWDKVEKEHFANGGIFDQLVGQ
jgi:sulfate transport system substrate-binding protein